MGGKRESVVCLGSGAERAESRGGTSCGRCCWEVSYVQSVMNRDEQSQTGGGVSGEVAF